MHETHLSTGEKAKARDILAAIRTLKTVEAEHRPATDDEKVTLRRFGGFGAVALSIFPDPQTGRFKNGREEIGRELQSLLTPAEYDSAKRTTFTAFFTSPVVMRSIHDAVLRLGVAPGATVLEPGCGTGRFMTGDHRYIGVELDSLSGRIARLLHPRADVRVENFRDTKLPPLDAVIGNVPFADVKMEFKGERLSLHDYFIAKSVDALKPGGVLAVVTSHYTLDKQNAAARESLAKQADFLGADPAALRRLQGRGHGGRHRHPVPAQAGAGERTRARRPRVAGNRAAERRGRDRGGQPLLPEPPRAWCSAGGAARTPSTAARGTAC